MPPVHSILFLLVFYLLLLIEFFVPSGGLLGLAAAVAGISAIVTAMLHSAGAGLAMLGIIVGTTPVIITIMLHVWPRTAIGRRVLNRQPGQVTPSNALQRTLPDGRPLSELIHCVGIALNDMLPSGLVLIDGHRIDAVSIGVPIDAGTHVIVTKIQAGKIQVRPMLENERQTSSGDPATPTAKSPEILDADLSQLKIDDLS